MPRTLPGPSHTRSPGRGGTHPAFVVGAPGTGSVRLRIGVAGESVESGLPRHLQCHACCADRKEFDIEPRTYARPAAPLISPRTARWVSINAGFCRIRTIWRWGL